jgi:O-antigen/teichoic acid export membrane protein
MKHKLILAVVSLLATILLGVMAGLLLDGGAMYIAIFLITLAWGYILRRLIGVQRLSEE